MITLRNLLLLLFSTLSLGILCAEDSTQTKAQFDKITSLRRDTNQVLALLSLYKKYFQNHLGDRPGTGKMILTQALQLSEELKFSKGIAISSMHFGELLFFQRKLDEASLYYFKCIQESENAHLTDYKFHGMQSLGIIYFDQRKFQTALNYFNEIQRLHTHKNQSYYTLEYLAGLCNLELGNIELAQKELVNSIEFAQENNNIARLNECRIALGKVYIVKNKFTEARMLFDSALAYFNQPPPEKAALALIYEQYSRLNLKQNLLSAAIENALISYQNAISTPNSINRPEITELLHQLYFKAGNIDKAYRYLRENQALKDSIYGKDISTEIALAMNAYEFGKVKNKYAEELKEQRRQRNRATIAAVIFICLMFIFIALLAVVRKERKKSEALLLNILPKETAAELKQFGHAIPKRHESVSVLFCDVKQFTTISENLAPEVLVKMLDFYISKFDVIISSHGLEKIKTIGDAYMCAGGLHNNFDSHAISAVSAAIDIMHFIKNSEKEMQRNYGTFFQFRVGVHTGPVVSGVVGSVKYAYDIWGDTVNTAARMEEKSEPGQINISEATYQLVKGKFEVIPRGNLEAKNKGPMSMYFLKI